MQAKQRGQRGDPRTPTQQNYTRHTWQLQETPHHPGVPFHPPSLPPLPFRRVSDACFGPVCGRNGFRTYLVPEQTFDLMENSSRVFLKCTSNFSDRRLISIMVVFDINFYFCSNSTRIVRFNICMCFFDFV